MAINGAGIQYSAPTDFRIPQTPPEGLPDDVKLAFGQLYSAIQQIILALVTNCGVGPRDVSQWEQLAGASVTLLSGNLNRFYVTAAEDIVYGAAITVGGSPLRVRNANAADTTLPCRGFCTAPTGIATGGTGEIQICTGKVGISGLTPGASYYLSDTPGLIAPVPATISGSIAQYVGFATDSTTLVFNVGLYLRNP